MIGLRANRADDMRVTHVRVLDNNRERFNTAPSAGGAKITGSVGVRVRNSVFADNFGTGLWFDASNYQLSVLSSRMRDNSLHGLFLEVSGTGTVANNVISRNRGNGLEINDTDRVQVWNNTFATTPRRSRSPRTGAASTPQGPTTTPISPYRGGARTSRCTTTSWPTRIPVPRACSAWRTSPTASVPSSCGS